MGTTPKIIPFKAEHMRAMTQADSLDDALARERGLAFTIVCDGMYIGAAGLILPWPGFAIAWAAFTPEVSKHNFFLTRTAKRLLDSAMVTLQLRRVECTVVIDNVSSQRWAHMLGFEHEGIAKHYTPDGRHVIRYARFK